MAKNNASDQDYTNNTDGFDIAGGVTNKRKLTLSLGDVAISGGGSATYTFPGSTDTLVGRASTDTLQNKTVSTGSVIDANVNVVEVLKKVYPIGSIYTNKTDSTNPASLFGFGTWTALAGRVIVGKAASGTFGTAGATMGAETVTLTAAESGVPAHTHGFTDNGVYFVGSGGTQAWPFGAGSNAALTAANTTSANTTAPASSGHNNIQPSLVAYMWERTA